MTHINKQRIATLDFIKFVAAILIVFHHFQGDFSYDSTLIKFSGGYVYFGYIVEMFFLISGFLMGMRNSDYKQQPFGKFMGNRLKRLLPMTTYSSVVFIILVILFKIFFDIWFYSAPLSPIMILKSLLLVYCGGALPYQNTEPNCILWYLCVLIICYAFYWIILFLAKKLQVSPRFMFAGMIFLGISLNAYSINLPFFNFYTSRGYMSFFFGVVLVEIFECIKNKKLISIFSFCILISFILYGYYDYELLLGTGLDQEMTLTFILYPALIGFFTNTICLQHLFDNKLIKLLGHISFEMYICQYHVFMIIHLLEMIGILKFPRNDFGMIIVLVLIISVSLFVYFFVEKPIAKAIKKS